MSSRRSCPRQGTFRTRELPKKGGGAVGVGKGVGQAACAECGEKGILWLLGRSVWRDTTRPAGGSQPTRKRHPQSCSGGGWTSRLQRRYGEGHARNRTYWWSILAVACVLKGRDSHCRSPSTVPSLNHGRRPITMNCAQMYVVSSRMLRFCPLLLYCLQIVRTRCGLRWAKRWTMNLGCHVTETWHAITGSTVCTGQ